MSERKKGKEDKGQKVSTKERTQSYYNKGRDKKSGLTKDTKKMTQSHG